MEAYARSARNAGLQRIAADELDQLDVLAAPLSELLRDGGHSYSEADLIFDFGYIGGITAGTLTTAFRATLGTVPQLVRWRNVVIAATAFPPDMSRVPRDSEHHIERTEWLAWNMTRAIAPRRLPAFGDYGATNPTPFGGDVTMIEVAASIRYTCPESWLIMRGRSTKRQGYGQFRDLSRRLIRRPEYSGPSYSWGDRYIADCASDRVGVGSLTTWRQVATSHHVSMVARAVATLP